MKRPGSVPKYRRRYACAICGRRFAAWFQIFQHGQANHGAVPDHAASLWAGDYMPDPDTKATEAQL